MLRRSALLFGPKTAAACGAAKVLAVLAEMAEINSALGEPFKVKSYQTAAASVQRHVATGKKLTSVAQLEGAAGVGAKIAARIDEVLRTGELAELAALRARPDVVAIRALTDVHGIGPRRALELFRQHGIATVADLAAAAARGQPGLELTAAQQLGLRHAGDFAQRIPHAEVALHERLLCAAAADAFGPAAALVVCGSYRRQCPTSGDVDALLTLPHAAKGAPLEALVQRLERDKYVVGRLALGPTKFMGVARLPGGAATARRVDVRLVDPAAFPTALLYFTGSKRFNTTMRAQALASGFTLNEYGLFRLVGDGRRPDALGAGDDGKSRSARPSKAQEANRVPVKTEKDVFDKIGMAYVPPHKRDS